VRKYRPFADGLVNWSTRPKGGVRRQQRNAANRREADLPHWPWEKGGKREEAVFVWKAWLQAKAAIHCERDYARAKVSRAASATGNITYFWHATAEHCS
jgi:hypothetical protein